MDALKLVKSKGNILSYKKVDNYPLYTIKSSLLCNKSVFITKGTVLFKTNLITLSDKRDMLKF